MRKSMAQGFDGHGLNGEASAGTNSALCPACRCATKVGHAFCMACFVKLPNGVKFMLADTRRRLSGISLGVTILKQFAADKEAAKGGRLFPASELEV